MKKDRKLIIGVIAVGAFISSLSQTIMTSSLPKIMEEFDIQAGVGQWLTTAYMLFLGIMIPCTGYMMERFSTKKLYLSSIFLFLIGCIIAAISSSFYMLLFARIIQALGAGILLPLPQVVTFRLYEPEKRGAIMGIVGLTTGFGPAIGPVFAGWIVDGLGWRAIYMILGVLSVLSIILALLKLKEEDLKSNGKLDVASVALSTMGFSGLLIGVTDQGNYGITSPLTYIPFLLGVICVAWFAMRQLKIDEPLLQLRVFKNRNFTLGTSLLVFAYGAMLAVSTLTPVYIQTCRGYSATMSGFIILPGALLLAFLNPVTGKILDKKGPFLLTVGGLFLLGLGVLMLALMGQTTPIILVGVAYGVKMLGIVALLQPLMTWSVNALSDEYVAHGTAIMNTIRQIGGAIISAVYISIMTLSSKDASQLHGIQTSLTVVAVLIFLCMAVAFIMMRRREEALPAAAAPETETAAYQSGVVITIAREYGSGGHEIGQRVAEKLGIDFYDKELIAMETRESGFSEDYVVAHDEETPAESRFYDYALKSYGMYESNLYAAGKTDTLDAFFDVQKKLIEAVAAKGPCVIIGRCADYILGNRKNCLRVFIKGDEESKLKRIAAEYDVPEENAPAESKKKDSERARHYKRYTGEKWGDAKNYDLVIDSSKMGINGTVSLITEAAALKK